MFPKETKNGRRERGGGGRREGGTERGRRREREREEMERGTECLIIGNIESLI